MNLTILSTGSRESAFAKHAVDFMLNRGDRFASGPGEINIVYFEGLKPDLTLNDDAPDRWNDLRTIIMFKADGTPYIQFKQICTTEPGIAATYSKNADRNGGVARLQLKQYRHACRVGFHKPSKGLQHPALVQVGDILVYRDHNRDMKRTGDPIRKAFGVNHHGTKWGFKNTMVGVWSEGCCVGWNFGEHLQFIEIVKTDPRYIADEKFDFDFALVGADELMKTFYF